MTIISGATATPCPWWSSTTPARRTRRSTSLRLFATNLHKAFYAFEPDFFQHNLLRIVDDVVSVIKGSLQLWPTLVEICYYQRGRKGLPQTRVKNRHK